MPLGALKPLRVGLAVVFLAATAFLFLDIRETGSSEWADVALYLQFVPSALDFLGGATLAAAGFFVVLFVTALFGRVYCSTVCPLGTVQDCVSRAARKRGGRFAYARPYTALRSIILGLTVLLFLTGSGLMLNLLDPFSGFGRMLANLVRPLLIEANNLLVPVVERMGSHAVFPMKAAVFDPISVVVALASLIAVGWLSARHGRLYCNAICPVGTLLGLVAKTAPFRVRIDADRCTRCGRCERVCKAQCLDFAKGAMDGSRCVGCFNCVAACRDDAVRLTAAPGKPAAKGGDEGGRRKFLLGLAAGGVGLTALTSRAALPPGFTPSRPTTIPEAKTTPVTPPGSGGVDGLTSRCTACHLCVAACPSRVIVPAGLDYGPSGVMQAKLDFSSAYCRYDCTVCSQVCPTGAIQPLTKSEKHRTQIGAAIFIKESCVVFTDNTNCGACSEHCPTKAVHMVPYLNAPGRKLVIPEMDVSICVGCGACERVCPTRPYKAIYVDGNAVHKAAKKPTSEELAPLPEAEDDFPF